MSHTAQSLSKMSLKEIATLVNVPSLVKVSKAKAIERALKLLPAFHKVKKADDAPRANKHAALIEALASPQNRAALMQNSGFDNKNLSVAMCNLKRSGYVIKVEMLDGERFYSIH